MTVRETLTDATQRLHGQNARRDADTLLAHTLGCDRAWLLAHADDQLAANMSERFAAFVQRRAAHEPLQYITGTQEFYGLPLRVTPATLIPRPETEHLVEAVLLWATRFHDEHQLRIADIGTGTGAIAIALATHLAGTTFIATDISEAALAVARENALTQGCADRIQFTCTDLLANVEGSFDAIVSNPPYIPASDATSMQKEVVEHEPHSALFAGADGLDIYRRLIPAAQNALADSGLLALEFGFGQRNHLAHLLADWDEVRFIDDYAGIPRTVLAKRPQTR